jgi:hypothetical protein
VHVKRGIVVKAPAGFAFITGLGLGRQVLTVYGFGQNPGTRGFTNAPGSAEQKSLGQVIAGNRIFKGSGYMVLAHYAIKSSRPVFTS